MDIKRLTSNDGLVSPRPVIPLTNMICGLFILTVSMISILIYWSFAWKIWDALSQSFLYPTNASNIFLYRILNFPLGGKIETSVSIVAHAFQVTILIFIVIFVRSTFVVFSLGLRRVGLAILQWTSSGTPEDVPIKYENPLEVAQWVGEKKEYRSKLSSQEAISVFGYGVQYVSPAAADIAQPIIDRILQTLRQGLHRSLGLVFMGWLFVGFLVTAPTWDVFYLAMPSISTILRNIGGGTTAWTIGGSYFLLLFTIGSCLFLDWMFVRLLSSRAKPPADISSRSENAQVAIAPYLLSERFQQDLERAERADGKADRVYRTGAEGASVSIADTGNFALLGLVEQYPRVMSNPNMNAGLMRLWSGWALIAIGAIILTIFLLPSATWNSVELRKLTEWKVFLDPVLMLILFRTGNRALREGVAMVAGGEALLETYWFEAPSLRYDFRGVTSKSEIRLGAAQDDSIRTSSSIVRSEFVARLTATNIITEVANPSSDRRIYGMQITEECGGIVDDVLRSLGNLSNAKPQPIGLDLSHPDVADTINANAAARAAKASAEKMAGRQWSLQSIKNEQLPPPSDAGEEG